MHLASTSTDGCRFLQWSGQLTVAHLTPLQDPAHHFWRVQSKHFRVLFNCCLSWHLEYSSSLRSAILRSSSSTSSKPKKPCFPQVRVLQLTHASGLLSSSCLPILKTLMKLLISTTTTRQASWSWPTGSEATIGRRIRTTARSGGAHSLGFYRKLC